MVATLLYSIAGGMLSVLATARVEQIAWKFLRLAGFIVLATPSGVTFGPCRSASHPLDLGMKAIVGLGVLLALGAIVAVLASPLAARWQRPFRWVCGFFGIAGIAAASVSAVTTLRGGIDSRPHLPAAAPLVILSQLLGALMLGSITVAWLLGHAYLTATKMTIAPLRHFTNLLTWFVIGRTCFVMLSIGLG